MVVLIVGILTAAFPVCADFTSVTCTPALSVGAMTSGGDGRVHGFKFAVTQHVQLTALGAYNFVGTVRVGLDPLDPEEVEVNGISSPVSVGIYTNGQLWISTLVQPADLLQGSYRYSSIQPLVLSPGIEYAVLAVYPSGGGNYYGRSSTPQYDSAVSFVGLSSANGSTLPSTPPGNTEMWSDQYGAANFLLSTNLSGASPCGIDFSGADLSGANLSGVDLSQAILSSADLTGADISGTWLDFQSQTDLIEQTTISNLNAALSNEFTLPEISDLRPGSSMIAVSNGMAVINFQIDTSTNLVDWVSVTNTSTATIPAETGTKFFRYRMD